MEWYWWVLVAIAMMFAFRRMRKKHTQEFSESERNAISKWLLQNNLDPETVHFTVYQDRKLLSDGADKLFVGLASGNDMRKGFVVETRNNEIFDAATIHPTAASWHARCASRALFLGDTLKGQLIEKSLMSHGGL